MKNEMTFKRRAMLLGSAATMAASFAMGVGITPASAQDADDDAAEVEEVVVTGSRIKNANISSPSPVTTVGAETISLRGNTQIEDMMTTLPQTVAARGDGDFSGNGTAQVDLRGLGAARTLVLVDGRRLPYGQANATPADLNSVPSALVSRVEVLTGGASAVYGADAVAGVVNFIMNRDYEGLSISAQASINQADNDSKRYRDILLEGQQEVPGSTFDGFTWSTDVVFGTNTDDGRGNITIAFNYREANEIRQRDRDYAACAFGGGDPEFYCLGSSTTRPARLASFGQAATNQFNLLAFDLNSGETRNFISSGIPNDTFNFAITQRTRAPSERFAITTFAHYELSEWAEFYMDMAFTSNTSIGQIGPSGIFFSTDTINCDNPFLNAVQLEEICTKNGLAGDDLAYLAVGRRNVEGGPRQQYNSNDTFRVNGGFRGDLSENWSYDLFGQFARVKNNRVLQNYVDPTRAQNSLIVKDVNGTPTCQVAIDGTDPLCVPYNIFQPGGITEEALNYISIPLLNSGRVNQKILSLSFTGDLTDYGMVMPNASTGVQFVGGIEYREDFLARQADDANVREGFQNIEEEVTVSEFFGELAVPLAEGMEMAEELSATAAFRWSDYNTTGTSNTWAVGLTWAPDDSVKFRVQAQQAVRAPNIFELYNDRGETLFDMTDENNDGIFDPCAGTTPYYTAAQCANQGITAAQYGTVSDNPAGQFNSISGGNPDLEVETSRTYTAGAVFTPESVAGLTFSADFYHIKVKDFVGTVPPELAVRRCAEDADPFFCSLVQRDPGGGLFVSHDTSFVTATNVNTGSLETKGIDFNASYSFDMPEGLGTMNLATITNYLMSYDIESLPGLEPFACDNYYAGDCIVPRPKWGSNTTATWVTEGGMGITATWRYIGSTKLLNSTVTTSKAYKLKATSYFDLAVSTEVAEGLTLRAGINNILGTRPPVTNSVPAGLGTGNTYPGYYDVDMRYGFVSLKADF